MLDFWRNVKSMRQNMSHYSEVATEVPTFLPMFFFRKRGTSGPVLGNKIWLLICMQFFPPLHPHLRPNSPITEAFGVEWHDEAASSAADSSLMAHSLHLGDGLKDRYRHSLHRIHNFCIFQAGVERSERSRLVCLIRAESSCWTSKLKQEG